MLLCFAYLLIIHDFFFFHNQVILIKFLQRCDLLVNSSASGNRMDENHACMNFHLSVSTEGAPVYEQKELRKQRRVPQGTILRMARAERTEDFS